MYSIAPPPFQFIFIQMLRGDPPLECVLFRKKEEINVYALSALFYATIIIRI